MKTILKCQYCKTNVPYDDPDFTCELHRRYVPADAYADMLDEWTIGFFAKQCKSCQRAIVGYVIEFRDYENGQPLFNDFEDGSVDICNHQIYPSIPEASINFDYEVPQDIKQDLIEAHQCLEISPRATAALCRRAVHAVLVDKADGGGKNFSADIETAKKSPLFLGYPSRYLEAVRDCGNYAVHQNWDKESFDLIQTSRTEADALLKVAGNLVHYVYKEIPELEGTLQLIKSKTDSKLSKRPGEEKNGEAAT